MCHVWCCLCRRIASMSRNNIAVAISLINAVIVKSTSQSALDPLDSTPTNSPTVPPGTVDLLDVAVPNPEILPAPSQQNPWLVTCMNLRESRRRLVTRQKRGAGPSRCSSQEPRGAASFPRRRTEALSTTRFFFLLSSLFVLTQPSVVTRRLSLTLVVSNFLVLCLVAVTPPRSPSFVPACSQHHGGRSDQRQRNHTFGEARCVVVIGFHQTSRHVCCHSQG